MKASVIILVKEAFGQAVWLRQKTLGVQGWLADSGSVLILKSNYLAPNSFS
jgi:hypothetical protein